MDQNTLDILRNKIEKLEKLLNGGKGSGNPNPGHGRGIGKPSSWSYLSSQAKNLTWSEYQTKMKDKQFRKSAEEAGLKSYDDLWQFWAETKNKDFSSVDIHELDEKTTRNIIENTIPKNVWLGWFRSANSDYKPIIVNKILENKELRNAGLNLAYQNYKNLNDKPLSFNEFLNTEMKMYRGHREQETIESDWFDSYTPKREFAERFGNKIKTISIKPKDTLGSYTSNAESEYLILTRLKQENSIQFNGGPGSGNFGHSRRSGKVGGSGKTTSATLAKGRMRKGVREYNPGEGVDGGFTINLDSGESKRLGKSSGYAVGGYGTEKIVSMEDWNKNQEKIIRDYYKQNKKLLGSKEGYYLGGWVPTKNSTNDKNIVGKVVLDVSRVFESKRDAAKEAIKRDQDSITDFKGFDWPTKEQLAKEFGLEKELKKASGKRQAERSQNQ